MKFNKNMGMMDRIIRIAIAVFIFILDYTEIISGPISWILSILAVVFVLTSVISFCPLYTLLGFNSNKKQDK